MGSYIKQVLSAQELVEVRKFAIDRALESHGTYVTDYKDPKHTVDMAKTIENYILNSDEQQEIQESTLDYDPVGSSVRAKKSQVAANSELVVEEKKIEETPHTGSIRDMYPAIKKVLTGGKRLYEVYVPDDVPLEVVQEHMIALIERHKNKGE